MNRNINDVKTFLFKKKLYIILITIIFIITGVSYNLTNVEYVSKQKLLIGKENTNLIDTYKEFVKGSELLSKVKDNLGLDISVSELADMVESSKIDNTNMIEISVHGENTDKVNQISDEIAKVFITTVGTIYGDTEIYKVDNSSNYNTNGNTIIIALLSAILGFVASSLFFAISYITDIKLRSCNDIEKITGLKSLISIPNQKSISKKKLTIDTLKESQSKIFKVLMTNIQFVNTNKLKSKSILITSPNEADGKTYVSLNLAMEFAKAGKKVIVIDADMRKGRIAKIFNLPIDFGFSNYLSNLDSNGNYINDTITRFINDTEIKNLSVITSGIIPPNPAELLKEDKITQLIKDLKVFYDIIIFDSVHILGTTESKKLAKYCDLTLILSAYRKTKKEDLFLAYEELNYFEDACIGVGFNRVPDKKLKKKIEYKKVIKTFLNTSYENMGKCANFIAKNANVLLNKIKKKSKDVKEFIQTRKLRKEEIKLIEAAQNSEKNNIVKKVFESKKETVNEPKNENEKVEAQINAKVNKIEEEPKVEEVNNENVDNIPIKVNNEKIDKAVNLHKNKASKSIKKVFDKAEMKKSNEKSEKKELEKISLKEPEKKKKTVKEAKANYKPINLAKQPVITEEMVRRQVEMDEMIRLAEKTEEEERQEKQRIRSDKRIEIYNKLKSNIKKVIERTKLTEEEKIQKQKEKLEKKEELAKAKEEKKKAKELEKQKEKEQMRISIEIHDDNIYPRPRM